MVIPAHPLALGRDRKLDERRQRALTRYYLAAGAGGLAVGVHTTQFAIRDPAVGLLEPVLALAAEEADRADGSRAAPVLRIAGVCGRTPQAVAEATLARDLRYHAALLSLAAMPDADDDALLDHCRAVADILPLVGFYLQPAVGGRPLGHGFWRRFAEIDNAIAIKIAPFDRYRTLDAVRAVAESGRDDIALYTGNDDNIVLDLLTPFRFIVRGRPVERRIVGGLLGHWAVWTRKAVELLDQCHRATPIPPVTRDAQGGTSAPSEAGTIPADLLRRAAEITDANAAIFDAANNFAGCIPGIHEVLRRQRLLDNTLTLNPNETLSPGQLDQLDRVHAAYPHLNDDPFVAEHLDAWMR